MVTVWFEGLGLALLLELNGGVALAIFISVLAERYLPRPAGSWVVPCPSSHFCNLSRRSDMRA